ncbi:M15 family metallopeptidase [Demequina gelatinilytica]|uniref:M15 family metallopeptidase n=1 Tax=Demequina gelatinilytica TaxID=1638980 RepID=UPI00078498DC|nr:M15 family metallopeptidase [Demequina gelatinilytica]
MTETLVNLSTPGQLLARTARSYESLLRATGHGTTIPGHAMRTLEMQINVFKDYYTTDTSEPLFRFDSGAFDTRLWNGSRWFRRAGRPSAAIPGTSNHGKGRAVDFQGLGGFDTDEYNTFAREATKRGWDNAEGKRVGEWWHWNHNPDTDTFDYEEDELMAAKDEIAAEVIKQLKGQAGKVTLTWATRRSIAAAQGKKIDDIPTEMALDDVLSYAARATFDNAALAIEVETLKAKVDKLAAGIKVDVTVDETAIARKVVAELAEKLK